MKKLPISLLIPTMNRPTSLQRTLNTFFNASAIPSQIVIIDQSENKVMADENRKVVEFYNRFCDVFYVYQEQASLTKARNNAYTYAKEEIVICSDDDVDVYSDTLENVYKIMSDKNIAMLGGINDGSKMSKTRVGYFLGTKSFIHRNIGHVTKSMLGRFPESFSENVPTMWAMGFFFVIKKSLKDKWMIQWDEKLPGYAYGEDLDFSYTYYKYAKKEKMICLYSTNVHVNHRVTNEYRLPSKQHTYMYVLNRAYLSKKHEMGLVGDVCMQWCNFWRYIERKIKKQNPQDMKEDMTYLRENKETISKGIFPY